VLNRRNSRGQWRCVIATEGLLVFGIGFLLAATCNAGQQVNEQTGSRQAAQNEPVVHTAKTGSRANGARATSPANSVPLNEPPLVGDDFKIGPDDLLAVNVWGEPEVSQTVPVRPDGKISLPLVGEVVASGKTAKQLATTIDHQLSNYLSNPEVIVIVREVKSQRIVVAGQVAKPGSYPLLTSMSVLDAIAQAGGPLEYAKLKSIYVLRAGPDSRPMQLRFNYKQVIRGRNLSQNILLQSHDTVVVP
jgi:polysaccharide export outer membrane protein